MFWKVEGNNIHFYIIFITGAKSPPTPHPSRPPPLGFMQHCEAYMDIVETSCQTREKSTHASKSIKICLLISLKARNKIESKQKNSQI